MTLWWIGNIIFLAVVIPVVVVLLQRVLTPVKQIESAANGILSGGVTIASQLDLLAGLIPTQESIKKIRAGVGQYGAALDKIL